MAGGCEAGAGGPTAVAAVVAVDVSAAVGAGVGPAKNLSIKQKTMLTILRDLFNKSSNVQNIS